MNEATRYSDARSVTKRLQVRCVLEMTSPAHIGGEMSLSLSDQPIRVDQAGRPYLPGTTLAGLLRHHMHALFTQQTGSANEEEESDELAQLFGARWNKDTDEQSALIVDDAPLDPEQTGKVELRDGVAISDITGTALPGKKFDREWLPVGTRFQLSFELLLSDDKAQNKIRLKWFLTLMQALEQERISLGARTSRGYGRCKAQRFSYRLFATDTVEGLLQWIGDGLEIPFWPSLEWTAADSIKDMTGEISQSTQYDIKLDESTIPCLHIDLKMFCPGSMLIGSSGSRPDDADTMHLHRLHQDNQDRIPIIPGTSLAGVLRHRALKIARTISGNNGNSEAKSMVDCLFGPEVTKDKTSQASRVQVEEAVLQGSPKVLRHARTMIDRWRGSAFEHHLFDADVLFGSQVTLQWKVLYPITKAEIALMLCLVKDIFTGDLPVGGETGIGRGVLYGNEGWIRFADSPEPVHIRGDNKGAMYIDDQSPETSAYFKALQKELQGGEV